MYYVTDPVHDSARKSITTSKPDLTENKENIRFLKFEKEDFAKFLSEQENQRTKTKTKQHVQLFQDYIFATKGDSSNIDTLDPATINEYLSSFYLGIRKKNESEYEPNYPKNIQYSLERHLRKQTYPKSITEDNEFYESREIWKAKLIDLRKERKR
jgi:hypothetical protein